MKDFHNKLAVVTGAGTGIGRALAMALVRNGAHVAFCDVFEDTLQETEAACRDVAPDGVRISAHLCDVADEAQVRAFRAAVGTAHAAEHIDLLFNNAGIAGGNSFLKDTREEWDRPFAVCWSGVYHCTRAFMPMLVASEAAYLVNTSSTNGFWACLGPTRAQTAYSTAKFAVRGFSEALVVDLSLNAPHVKVAVVLPGHVGTSIAQNQRRAHGKALELDASEIPDARAHLAAEGRDVTELSDSEVNALIQKRIADFRDKAPLSPDQAAEVILEGLRDDRWRILVGEDAKLLDRCVRAWPEVAYSHEFLSKLANPPPADSGE